MERFNNCLRFFTERGKPTLGFLTSVTLISLCANALYADGDVNDGMMLQEQPIATIPLSSENITAIHAPAEPAPPPPPSGEPFNFPLNADQNWFTKASYLCWKPYQDDMDYGNRLTTSLPGDPTTYQIKFHPKKPAFDWDSGVRVGIGTYLPSNDLWDLSFFVTYFYGDARSHSRPSPDKGSILTQQLEPDDLFDGSDKAIAHWQMNFFIGDLAIGRQFTLIPSIVVRPFIGVRGVMIDQDYKCRYQLFRVDSSTFTQLFQQKFKSFNDYRGIGPRFGTDFSYFITKHWAFLANFSSSLFIGSYRVREKTQAVTYILDEFNSESKFRYTDRGYTIRSNIEGYVGIGWEQWTNNHSVRIAPSILFEGSEWFDVNQLSRIPPAADYQLADTFPAQSVNRLHGDLGFLGFTFNLQMDF